MTYRPATVKTINRGYTFALLGAIFLSTTSIIIRHMTLTYQIPALILAFWRNVFVVATLIPAFWIINKRLLKIQRKHLGFLVFFGLIVSIFNSFWTLSVSINGAAVATVLVYCSAGFTVLLGWWILKEQLTWVKIVAVFLSLGGCVLVAEAYQPSMWNTNLAGILTGVLSGLSYALYSLLGRTASQRGLSPWTTLLYTFGFAGVFLLVINLIPGDFLIGKAMHPGELMWLGNRWEGWIILFLLAAIPTLAGFGFYNVSLSYLPSSIANLIVTMEPAFTAVTAYLLLGERLTPIQLIGSILTLSGVVFLRVFETKQVKSEPVTLNVSAQEGSSHG
ncbi:MAG: DMT family transporter [Anaerolineaceae bacterium]|nr:DMT family transporter [Anaerolineaceae bacterium]